MPKTRVALSASLFVMANFLISRVLKNDRIRVVDEFTSSSIEMNCLEMRLIGETESVGGYFVCDPQKFIVMYPNCIIYSVGIRDGFDFENDFLEVVGKDRCRFRAYDKRALQAPRQLEPFLKLVKANVSLYSSDTSLTLKDDLSSNNLNHKIALLKVDIGRDGFKLVSEQQLSLQACQLLIALQATPQEIQKFVQLMKYRAYLLFGARSWPLRARNSSTLKFYRRHYTLSFVKSYCIREAGPNYVFADVWKEEKASNL